jgi:hypothetical protein
MNDVQEIIDEILNCKGIACEECACWSEAGCNMKYLEQALSNNKDTSTKIISKQQGIIDELVEDTEKLQYSLQRVGKDSEVLDWLKRIEQKVDDLKPRVYFGV